MDNTIKAIAFAAFLQVVFGGWLTGFMLNRASEGVNLHVNNLVHDQYNRLEIERSYDQEEMKRWVDRRIDLKFAQCHNKNPHKENSE